MTLSSAAAWAVHLYTALGIGLRLRRVLATVQADYRLAFLWLVAATFIDATDGALARPPTSRRTLPRFDGARLDDIVDYVTYVFAPVFLMYRAGLLPRGLGPRRRRHRAARSAFGFARPMPRPTITSSPAFRPTGISWRSTCSRRSRRRSATPPSCWSSPRWSSCPSATSIRRGRRPAPLTLGLGAFWALMLIAIILLMPEVPRLPPPRLAVLSRLLHRVVPGPAGPPAPGLMARSLWSRRVRDRVFAVDLRGAGRPHRDRDDLGVPPGLCRPSADARRRRHVVPSADGRRWFRMDEHHQDVPLAESQSTCSRRSSPSRTTASTRIPASTRLPSAAPSCATFARRDARGRSTLTQQLARTLFLSNKRSYGRKAREAALAIMIDAQLSKTQILELYLNRIYLSAGVYGVETMSRHLFGKPAKQLTLAESALIAGLAKSPAGLSPWTNLDGAVARSHVVLARMRDEGFINAGQEEAAKYARAAHSSLPRLAGRARRLRQGVPAPAVPRRIRRRPPARLERADDVRPGAAGDRRAGGRGRPAPFRPSGAPGGARGAGSANRRHPGAGRRPGLRAVAVQPRGAQPPAARLGVQAAALRGGARERLLARVGARRAGEHRRRRDPRSGRPATPTAKRPTR